MTLPYAIILRITRPSSGTRDVIGSCTTLGKSVRCLSYYRRAASTPGVTSKTKANHPDAQNPSDDGQSWYRNLNCHEVVYVVRIEFSGWSCCRSMGMSDTVRFVD